jgi:predicted MFS family arabinose efflux permease
VTGLSFTAIGVGSIIGGAAGSRAIAATSARTTLVWGLILQAVLTVPIAFLGTASWWVVVIVVTTFLSGLVNLAAIVAFLVTATSGVAAAEQGVATGLATMSQQIGFTTGIPIMSAIVTAYVHAAGRPTPHTLLRGIDIALLGNAALALATAGLVALAFRTTDRRLVHSA